MCFQQLVSELQGFVQFNGDPGASDGSVFGVVLAGCLLFFLRAGSAKGEEQLAPVSEGKQGMVEIARRQHCGFDESVVRALRGGDGLKVFGVDFWMADRIFAVFVHSGVEATDVRVADFFQWLVVGVAEDFVVLFTAFVLPPKNASLGSSGSMILMLSM